MSRAGDEGHERAGGTGDGGSPPPPFDHVPVMVDQIVPLLAPVPPGVLLDATVGGGGHAAAALGAHPHLRLVGLDQDDQALAAAGAVLAPFGDRAVLRRARFDRLDAVLDDLGVASLSAVLFDLGVSSPQFDRPERGFSYRADAPLDMRMDRDRSRTAADVVNTYDERALARLFAASGEARFARRIAAAVVRSRPVTTTGQLADIVRDAIPAPARRTGGHPAKRVFQALRLEVNAELEVLPVALDAALDRLAPGGRLLVLAYHSGEDR
ncbi:MAG TPA: 16S rRNA (cytosine(1402)-N(4))-methyltransferase RsmH, partial [Acidimicrobiales bacterium]|nr:16S rRNA (cytosine(1402)-N(4))-methyltransferase RsmH [Acidimicrobiales bacterium]